MVALSSFWLLSASSRAVDLYHLMAGLLPLFSHPKRVFDPENGCRLGPAGEPALSGHLGLLPGRQRAHAVHRHGLLVLTGVLGPRFILPVRMVSHFFQEWTLTG